MAYFGRPAICGLGCGDLDPSSVEIVKTDDEDRDSEACPVCGYKNRVGAKFCSECGAKTREEEYDGMVMREPVMKGRQVIEETEPPPEGVDIFGKVISETAPPVETAAAEAAPSAPANDASASGTKDLKSSSSLRLGSENSSLKIMSQGTAEEIFGTKPLAEGEFINQDHTLEHKPLEITFWFQGDETTRTFVRRPLGMSWKLRSPVTIDKVKKGSHADELGVQLGWQIKVIGGTDVSGQPYKKIGKFLGHHLQFLPWSKNENLDASQSMSMV
mmetsp:Transcript_99077/g.171744  ORF Transcript_99077/g.171744 Transcript_99077/m.171744 type:complete len:273 (+) Transcript_99077:159-977(+)